MVPSVASLTERVAGKGSQAFMLELKRKTPEEIIQEMGGLIGQRWAASLIRAMPPLKEEGVVRVMPVRPSDLGVDHCCTYRELYHEFNEFGFQTCPPQVGPALKSCARRLALETMSLSDDHPMRKTALNLIDIRVAMEPIIADGLPAIFHLREGWLDADAGGETVEYSYHGFWLVQIR